ncbi:IS1 family transposase [Escherichia coli]
MSRAKSRQRWLFTRMTGSTGKTVVAHVFGERTIWRRWGVL